MTRVLVTETTLVVGGVVETQVAGDSANGHYIVNRGDTVLHLINGSGGEITVTLVTAKTVDGIAIADISIAVAAGTEQFVKPLNPSIFNNNLGQVNIDLTADTSFFLANLKI